MIEQILIENGFTKKEAKIYVSVLGFGEAPIARIANAAKVNRTTAYSLIESMHARGLLSFNKRSGIKYISALPPRLLVERFLRSAKMAESSLPELIEMAYSSPLKPRFQFYDGLEGLKEILREFSFSKEPTMGFTDYEQMPKELLEFIRREVVPQRKKLNNPVRLIIPRNETNVLVKKQDKANFAEHRLVIFPESKNPIEILLYETNKVAFLSFTKAELFGVIIDSQAIHQTLRNLFLLLWQNAPE